MNTVIQSNDLLIRRTNMNDISFITEIENLPENSIYVGQWSKNEHCEALSNERILHLTVEKKKDQKKIGYLILDGINDPNCCVELKRIVITDKGLGYGKETIHLIKQLVFKYYNTHRLWLDVKSSNLRARALYQSSGFKEEGILRDCLYNKVDQTFESLVIMSILRAEY